MARDWLVEKLPKNSIGCEKGVWVGAFSYKLLTATKPKILYLVDPWKVYPSQSPLYGNGFARTQKDLDILHDSVVNRFKNSPSVKVLRQETLTGIPDNYLDWIYVDGDHSYESVTSDLLESLRVVKIGGIIAGDDFQTDGWWGLDVINAVLDFIKQYPVKVEIIKSNQFILRKI